MRRALGGTMAIETSASETLTQNTQKMLATSSRISRVATKRPAVSAPRRSVTSLVTREIRLPVRRRWKKSRERVVR
jgi:hypothetical protein